MYYLFHYEERKRERLTRIVFEARGYVHVVSRTCVFVCFCVSFNVFADAVCGAVAAVVFGTVFGSFLVVAPMRSLHKLYFALRPRSADCCGPVSLPFACDSIIIY